jgi:hypothetical protein
MRPFDAARQERPQSTSGERKPGEIVLRWCRPGRSCRVDGHISAEDLAVART